MDMTIKGLQQAQQGNLKAIAAMKPSGAFGNAIRTGTVAAHRYAVAQTHVDTGALKASHRMVIAGLEGTVFIDQGARNPRSRVLTSQYGPIEHARGGEHAFYEIVEKRYGTKIAIQAGVMLIAGMP